MQFCGICFKFDLNQDISYEKDRNVALFGIGINIIWLFDK